MMIEVKVTSALLVSGLPHQPGEVLSVKPLAAADLIRSGRAKLVDPADIAILNDAEKAHTLKVCRAASSRRPNYPGEVRVILVIGDKVHCEWFVGLQRQQRAFPANLLRHVRR